MTKSIEKKPVIKERLTIYSSRTLGNLYKCYYCGRDGETTADHFHPRSKGGRLRVRACRQCQTEKADCTPAEWIAILRNFIKHCATNRQGCKRGEFIRSFCDGECGELERRRRMLRASETLLAKLQKQ